LKFSRSVVVVLAVSFPYRLALIGVAAAVQAEYNNL
jgi:hypothetical protein